MRTLLVQGAQHISVRSRWPALPLRHCFTHLQTVPPVRSSYRSPGSPPSAAPDGALLPPPIRWLALRFKSRRSQNSAPSRNREL